jgi:hypothetical protein
VTKSSTRSGSGRRRVRRRRRRAVADPRARPSGRSAARGLRAAAALDQPRRLGRSRIHVQARREGTRTGRNVRLFQTPDRGAPREPTERYHLDPGQGEDRGGAALMERTGRLLFRSRGRWERDHPQSADRLRSRVCRVPGRMGETPRGPQLAGAAIEEVLRFVTPIRAMRRTATRGRRPRPLLEWLRDVERDRGHAAFTPRGSWQLRVRSCGYGQSTRGRAARSCAPCRRASPAGARRETRSCGELCNRRSGCGNGSSALRA